MHSSTYLGRVTYIHGSVTKDDMKRASIRQAIACFIVPDNTAPNEKVEDQNNILRTWTINAFAPQVPLYVYNLLPGTEKHGESYVSWFFSSLLVREMSEDVVCVNEIRYLLAGYNAVCEGTSTLISNLLIMYEPGDQYDDVWQEQYADGIGNEFYNIPAHRSFYGKTFIEVVSLAYQEFQVTMIAVRSARTQKLHINPGNSYHIQANDQLLFVAQSPRELKEMVDIRDTRMFDKSLERISNYRLALKATTTSIASAPSPRPRKNSIEIMPIPGHIGKVDSPYDLPEDRDLPLCHVLPKPVALEQALLLSGADMEDHIVVCSGNFELYRLIMTMRSTSIPATDLQSIIILCERIPTDEEWSHLSSFPSVFVMTGDCLVNKDLIRSNVVQAKSVILINLAHGPHHEGYTDTTAIIAYRQISSVISSDRTHIVVELTDRQSVQFAHAQHLASKRTIHYSLSEEDFDLQDSVLDKDRLLFSPAYASGSVLVPNLLDTILVHAYRQPQIILLLKTMCGVR